MKSENVIRSGSPRSRHGSYRSVYLDNKGGGRRYWRADYQSVSPSGVVRLRRWFTGRDEAWAWLYGKI